MTKQGFGMILGALALAMLPAQAQTGMMKPAIQGLVTMGELTFLHDPHVEPDNTFREANAHPGVYSAVVILAKWSSLEPEQGKFNFTEIDEGLKNVRAYNAKYPKTPITGKLRLFAGPNAPKWAMQLGGAPVEVQVKDHTLPIGRFWTKEYGDAYRNLQAQLAGRYDNDLLLQEVAISSCTSSSAEPFLLPLVPTNVKPLQAAGYTDEAVRACLLGAIDDFYAVWKHTAVDYTFNQYRALTPDGQIVPHPEFTTQVIEAFRKKFGSRGVIANHGLAEVAPPRAIAVLADIMRVGPPIEFQTVNQQVKWDLTFQEALKFHTTEFEIWDTKDAGGSNKVSYDQLKAWKAAMAAQK